MKYIILLLTPILLNAQAWNYSADILEKKVENDRELRIFKSTELGNKQVVIYNDVQIGQDCLIQLQLNDLFQNSR